MYNGPAYSCCSLTSSGRWLLQSVKNAFTESHPVTSIRYQHNYVNAVLFC